ncbi:MAG TPA: leucine-rich repeat domain-containing protein, partial [Verrucomicrobiae bacterium]|nr:leucine-rich repeat domain-containing protein [Verrucomicrobiae bacterium]
TNIGAEAFVQCENLAGINVDALNPFYSSSNGFLFDKHQTALIEAPGTVAGNYIIPGSVTNIATGAFMDCANLTGVVISNRVAIVGTNAFTGCTGLSNILIGTNVLGIAMSAFQGCSGLTDATIPRSVVRLGAGVFNDCSSLTNVLIHSGVTNIESGLEGLASFDLRILSLNAIQVAGDCPRLMAITVTGTSLYYSSTNGILFNQPQTVLLEAPGGFAGGYTVPETVTNIAPGAFNACTNLTSLVIPNRVISIGGGAFDACGGLTNVVIGTNVTSIGQKAFSFCGALGTVAIPAGVTNIGDGALTGCRSLTNISVDPKNLYYSSFNGFLFDKHFTRLIQAPGGYAGNYTVPNSVTNIGDEAFENCSNLRDVTLGANISSIGNQAFFECNNLMSLFFKGNAPSAASMVFGGVARRLPPIIGGQPLLLTPPVIYYLPGAQGWSATFGGQPAVPWNLQVQTGGAGLGVRTNRFGFNITGSSDVEIVVEACTNLTKPNWLPVQTNVLTEGATYFSDAQWTNYPGRYYRFRSE